MNKQLRMAIQLRRKGECKKALNIILNLLKSYPDDSLLNYHCAWTYDNFGKERKAISHYEKALQNGLNKKQKEAAFIGLASSYRCIGQYKKAHKILLRANKEFSKNRALRIFLAMTLYNLRKYHHSMSLLVRELAETSSDHNISNYRKAFLFYHDKLDRVWNK